MEVRVYSKSVVPGATCIFVDVNRQQSRVVWPLPSERHHPDLRVLVFSTSVESEDHIRRLRPSLDLAMGNGCWNFDLDDCDRILRIVSDSGQPKTAIQILHDHGFECEELQD